MHPNTLRKAPVGGVQQATEQCGQWEEGVGKGRTPRELLPDIEKSATETSVALQNPFFLL